MATNSVRDKIRKVNEEQKMLNEKKLNERLVALTAHEKENDNPIHDFIVIAEESSKINEEKKDSLQVKDENVNVENLSSLQDRFGVSKIYKPVKDAQLTARIDSKTLKRFKEIVKTMYYPDKPNINETVTQILYYPRISCHYEPLFVQL